MAREAAREQILTQVAGPLYGRVQAESTADYVAHQNNLGPVTRLDYLGPWRWWNETYDLWRLEGQEGWTLMLQSALHQLFAVHNEHKEAVMEGPSSMLWTTMRTQLWREKGVEL